MHLILVLQGHGQRQGRLLPALCSNHSTCHAAACLTDACHVAWSVPDYGAPACTCLHCLPPCILAAVGPLATCSIASGPNKCELVSTYTACLAAAGWRVCVGHCPGQGLLHCCGAHDHRAAGERLLHWATCVTAPAALGCTRHSTRSAMHGDAAACRHSIVQCCGCTSMPWHSLRLGSYVPAGGQPGAATLA